MFNSQSKTIERCDKEFGRKLTVNTMDQAICKFFCHIKLLSFLESKLVELIHALSISQVRMYSCSLLILYKGDHQLDDFNCKLRLIDFAHSFVYDEDIGADSNVLEGLENLLQITRSLLSS